MTISERKLFAPRRRDSFSLQVRQLLNKTKHIGKNLDKRSNTRYAGNMTTDTLSSINRSEMARAVGVDVAHISRILAGIRTPSPELAQRMADYLGMPLAELHELLHIEPVDTTVYRHTS